MVTFVNSSVGLLIHKLKQFATSVTVDWLVAQVRGSEEELTAKHTLPAVLGCCTAQRNVGFLL